MSFCDILLAAINYILFEGFLAPIFLGTRRKRSKYLTWAKLQTVPINTDEYERQQLISCMEIKGRISNLHSIPLPFRLSSTETRIPSKRAEHQASFKGLAITWTFTVPLTLRFHLKILIVVEDYFVHR